METGSAAVKDDLACTRAIYVSIARLLNSLLQQETTKHKISCNPIVDLVRKSGERFLSFERRFYDGSEPPQDMDLGGLQSEHRCCNETASVDTRLLELRVIPGVFLFAHTLFHFKRPCASDAVLPVEQDLLLADGQVCQVGTRVALLFLVNGFGADVISRFLHMRGSGTVRPYARHGLLRFRVTGFVRPRWF